jgi:hypothetical protein
MFFPRSNITHVLYPFVIYLRTVPRTINIIKTEKEGRRLNAYERYHIYKISKDRLQVNDTNIDRHNPIFEALQD